MSHKFARKHRKRLIAGIFDKESGKTIYTMESEKQLIPFIVMLIKKFGFSIRPTELINRVLETLINDKYIER